MPQQRKRKGGRLPLAVENERVDFAIEAMRLNPGNAYRAATWLKDKVGCTRRTATNLLARARARIVAACQADMSSAFGELWADVRAAMAQCRPSQEIVDGNVVIREANWPAFFRGANVAGKLIEMYLDKIRRDEDAADVADGEIIFRIVESVEVTKDAG